MSIFLDKAIKTKRIREIIFEENLSEKEDNKIRYIRGRRKERRIFSI